MQKDASLKDKPRKSDLKNEKAEIPTFTIPQFINVTNSTALDESARTQVRAQVMRDYHRRRIQKATHPNNIIQDPVPKEPSAKGQTHKFRFGKEKGLRPWVPVKGPPGKRRQAGRGRGKVSISEASDEFSNTSSSMNNGRLPPDSTAPDQQLSFMSSSETGPVTGSADQWLSSLDFAVQTSVLYHSPGAGFLDPFATTSLLITPRTQVLIHHYCKLQCTIPN